MIKIAIPVTSAGYAADFPNDIVEQTLDGGPARRRRDVIGAPFGVSVAWVVGPADYDYLMAFYRSGINRGTDPFLIDLVLDSSQPTEYTASLKAGTFKLQQQQGLTYHVTAQLEVLPIPDDPNGDDILLARNS